MLGNIPSKVSKIKQSIIANTYILRHNRTKQIKYFSKISFIIHKVKFETKNQSKLKVYATNSFDSK